MIKKVSTKKELNNFIYFVRELYKDKKDYGYPIFFSLKKELKKQVLVSKKYTALLCLKEGKTVGRILYTIDYSKQEKKNIGYFSYFDLINDLSVAKELLSFMENDLKGKVDFIEGTFTPYDPDTRRGVLVEGFDEPHTIFTSYNEAYLQNLLIGCGYEKAHDTYTVNVPFSADVVNHAKRVAEFANKRNEIEVSTLNLKKLDKEMEDIALILKQATTEINYQEAPDIDMIKAVVKGMRLFIEPSLVVIARHKQSGQPVGFLFALPDYNQVFAESKGRLNLLTLNKNKKKITRCRGILQYVVPEYQMKGVLLQLFAKEGESMQRLNYTYFEGGTIMEENFSSFNPFFKFGGRISKVYRLFFKEI